MGSTPASGVGGGATPPPEQVTSYTYSPTDGRLKTVANASNSFTYGYEPNSNLIKTVTSPIHTVTNTWETTRDILTSKENKAGAFTRSGYTYGVNEMGQRTDLTTTFDLGGNLTSNPGDTDWGYNSKGEVVKADHTIPGLDRAYVFDGIGNRLKAAEGTTDPEDPTAKLYTPNALNQYTAIDTLNPVHDADGNMTSGSLPANVNANSTLVWDGENRLIEAQVTGGGTATYLYDSQSRRIATISAAVTTLTIYDGWNPIAEYSISNNQYSISKSFTWGIDLSGSIQGAGGVGGLLMVSEISNSQISNYFPTFDGNGNVSEYLNSTGTVVAHYEYDPFGRTTVATGSKANDFSHRFSTKPLDSATGLYYYGYRYYDPVTGRWPSRDPIEEMGGINLYGFVGNRSPNFVDVLGLEQTLTSSSGSVNEPFTWTQKNGNADPFTPNALARFSVKREVTREGCTLIVTISVNLAGGSKPVGQGMGFEDQPGYKAPSDKEAQAMRDEFQKGIDAAWNGRFKICCDKLTASSPGGSSYTFTDPKHCCCEVSIRLEHDPRGPRVGIFSNPASGSNQFNWNTAAANATLGQTAAHEIGHFLGNTEEYGTATDAHPVGKSNEAYGQGDQRPENSVMGSNPGQAHSQHLWRVLQQLGDKSCKISEK